MGKKIYIIKFTEHFKDKPFFAHVVPVGFKSRKEARASMKERAEALDSHHKPRIEGDHAYARDHENPVDWGIDLEIVEVGVD